MWDKRAAKADCTTSDPLRESIRRHINSIPRIDRHYCCARTAKKYIDGSLNTEKTYVCFFLVLHLIICSIINVVFNQLTASSVTTCSDCNSLAHSVDAYENGIENCESLLFNVP